MDSLGILRCVVAHGLEAIGTYSRNAAFAAGRRCGFRGASFARGRIGWQVSAKCGEATIMNRWVGPFRVMSLAKGMESAPFDSQDVQNRPELILHDVIG